MAARWLVPVFASLTLISAAARAQDPELAPPREPAASAGSPDERIESLEEQVRQLRATIRSPDVPAPPVPREKPRYPSIGLNGMLHIDGGVVAQDAANEELVGDIDNSLGFRRARIGVDGFITEQLYYRLVPDFALNGRPSFRDAYIEYRDLDGIGTIRLGESRQPFGMESQTPARDLLFLERSLAFALSPFRQTGLGLRNRNAEETVTWHAAAFGFPTDTWGNAVNDSGFGLAGRTTAILWEDDTSKTLVHTGAGYVYTHAGEAGLRYRSTPESGGLQTGASGSTPVVPPFVDTGLMDNARSNAFDLELAVIRGPLVFQGEAVTAHVDLDTGQSASFQGGYIHLLYSLTGERHTYNREFGYLERLVPDDPLSAGGIGAWELAARLSTLDLQDSLINGGRIHDLTLGLNWFLNNHARLQFNYIHSWVDRAPVGDNEADIYASRLAVDF